MNTVGVMGKGIALQFKRRFPGNYQAYRQACDAGEVTPGRMFVWRTDQLGRPHWIVNFPTKRHWKAKSRIEDIEAGLRDLQRVVLDLGIQSLAVPPLGCGNGGLSWSVVRPLIERYLGAVEGVRVAVYEPAGAPPQRPCRTPEEATDDPSPGGNARCLRSLPGTRVHARAPRGAEAHLFPGRGRRTLRD